MKNPNPYLRCLAGTAVAVLAMTACTGNAETDVSPAGNDDGAQKALVATRDVDGAGTVLVDGDGMTLYSTDAEADGSIKCVDACIDFWVPLAAAKADVPENVDGVTGKLSVLTRPDRTTQLALDGRPLYTFSEDRTPGSVKGDGFEDDFMGTHFVWTAAAADGTAPAKKAPSDQKTPSDEDTPDEGDSGGSGDGGGYGY